MHNWKASREAIVTLTKIPCEIILAKYNWENYLIQAKKFLLSAKVSENSENIALIDTSMRFACLILQDLVKSFQPSPSKELILNG